MWFVGALLQTGFVLLSRLVLFCRIQDCSLFVTIMFLVNLTIDFVAAIATVPVTVFALIARLLAQAAVIAAFGPR